MAKAVGQDGRETATGALHRLAQACGIEVAPTDAEGRRRLTPPDSLRAILHAMGHRADDEAAAAHALKALEAARRDRPLPPVCVVRAGKRPALPVPLGRGAEWRIVEESGGIREGGSDNPLPGDLPIGYHRLHAFTGDREADMPLIVVPRRCFVPAGYDRGTRPWGIAAHLYTLRSDRHWGIGDFGDLRRLGAWAAKRGAATIGINPLHALSPLDPGSASPYFPSSRLFLNPIYLDIPALPEFERSETARRLVSEAGFEAAVARVRAADLTDHAGVAALKERVLEALYRDFERRRDECELRAFDAFCAGQGDRLDAFACYQALAEHFSTPNWHDWPVAYRDPCAAAVEQFVEAHGERLRYRAFVQWLCTRQLAETRTAMKDADLTLGLYGDMALGVDPAGADAWMDRAVYTGEAELGVPPDDFSPNGQTWGIAAPVPEALRETGYTPFIDALRVNMANADILRIDHVMALQRCFWVPKGMDAGQGAYVDYPLDDLIGIVALESRRAGTMVVGEDLGTVLPPLRRAIEEAGIFSYSVLYFEKKDHHFRAPDRYRRRAVACVGTHDLPPLAGYWRDCDIAIRRELDLFPTSEIAEKTARDRDADRAGILAALRDAGMLDMDPDDPAALRRAVHCFLARTRSWLVLLQIDDLLGETTAINLPDTEDEHPNWRRKLRLGIADIIADKRITAELQDFAAERGSDRG